MEMLSHNLVQTISQPMLAPLAQTALDCPNLKITAWELTPLSVQGQRSVFRFTGIGYDGATPRTWSLILKEIRAPESADDPANEPDCPWYWPRESLLYATGIPQSLSRSVPTSRLRAPRCFGVWEPIPPVRWIWLEDLQDCYAGRWPLERYALAAYHLGLFNGSSLMGQSVPPVPWLMGNSLRYARTFSTVTELQRLRDPKIWTHPLLRRAFAIPVLPELERLVADRKQFLAGIMDYPQAFCHLDAHADNMALLSDSKGGEVTVLFDWALAGYGAPGEEISRLVWAALLDFKVDVADAERLESMVFDQYLQGLVDTGWQADPVQVRYAYLMSSVLIFTLEMEAVDHAFNEDVAGLETYYGWPQERLVEQNAQVTYLLLKRADQLRAILNTR